MVTVILLNSYKRIIDKLAIRLSVLEGEDKLLDESLADAGLTDEETEIVHEIAVSNSHSIANKFLGECTEATVDKLRDECTATVIDAGE